MSKSNESDPAEEGYRRTPRVRVHVNPMYIVVTQKPPGQTISVQITVTNSNGTESTISLPDVEVGTTILNTSAKVETLATELIIVADDIDP